MDVQEERKGNTEQYTKTLDEVWKRSAYFYFSYYKRKIVPNLQDTILTMHEVAKVLF